MYSLVTYKNSSFWGSEKTWSVATTNSNWSKNILIVTERWENCFPEYRSLETYSHLQQNQNDQ